MEGYTNPQHLTLQNPPWFLYTGQATCRMHINGGAVIRGSICSITCWQIWAIPCSTSITGVAQDMGATGVRVFTGIWAEKTFQIISTRQTGWSGSIRLIQNESVFMEDRMGALSL